MHATEQRQGKKHFRTTSGEETLRLLSIKLFLSLFTDKGTRRLEKNH